MLYYKYTCDRKKGRIMFVFLAGIIFICIVAAIVTVITSASAAIIASDEIDVEDE